MSPDQEKIKEIIMLLEHIRDKPFMWVLGKISIVEFLNGLKAGVAMSNVLMGDRRREDNIYEKVVKQHQWDYSARGEWYKMEEKGLDYKAIIQEIVDVEIEVIKKRYHVLESNTPS